MKQIAPEYLLSFKCIADTCRHTCCVGWDIDIDAESAKRYATMPDVAKQIEYGDPPHMRLLPGERCPFLREDGLCRMIIDHGEDALCQICRDHPRFRNFWTDRTELGLGLVCEEAGRLILGRETPMKLIVLSDDGNDTKLPEDEAFLLDYRAHLLDTIPEVGPLARLREYLIYRHIPDALYDGRLEARTAFVDICMESIRKAWSETDGTLDALVEICRVFSYDVEYDDEVLERWLS